MDQQPINVLIIDDDEDDCILTRDLLTAIPETDFVVDWVANGNQALEAIEAGKYDVYLIDYRLGEHNGLDIIARARQFGCTKPMILLTGQGDQDVDRIAIKAGASDYLLKNKIDGQLLERSIRYACDRTIAAKELWESEEKYRALAENSTDVIMRFDRQFRHLYVNAAVEKALGKKPGEVISRTHRQLGFKDRIVNFWETHLERLFVSGQPIHVEFEGDTTGEPAFYDVRFIPEFTASSSIDTAMVTMRDITETRRLQEFSHRAQKLEAAGRIAGQVAHDFNNLLGPMVAYPDLMSELIPQDHPVLPYLEKIKYAALQISDINQQLLTLGRRGHYDQKVLSLNRIIAQAIEHLGDIPKSLHIDLRLDNQLRNIKGGGSQLFRVISNLISNARDAMQDNGDMTVITENVRLAGSVLGRLGPIPEGTYVKLTVADNGCGIHDDILSKIFDPFFTTKAADKKRGSGLGLSVVHAVVEDHHGYIDCTSELGKGTSIYIFFRVTEERVEFPAAEQAVGGDEKILVVDDDQIQREVTCSLLEKLGYLARSVESGEAALDYIRDNPQDLLILDMIMPGGMDGTETLGKILEINPAQKAIIVSGYAESERVMAALAMGAGSFIRKPLTLKMVAHAVRRELDKALVVSQ